MTDVQQPDLPPFHLPHPAPYVAGIDPGFGGGVAFLNAQDLVVYDMPTMAGLLDVDRLSRMFMAHPSRLVVCERAGSMPQQGVASTFKFGMSFGAALAVPACLKIPMQIVTARSWKAHFKLDKDKENARALAIMLFPGSGWFDRKKDHNRAEAALIAAYGWHKFVNQRSGTDGNTD
jgi:hypothetical protein